MNENGDPGCDPGRAFPLRWAAGQRSFGNAQPLLNRCVSLVEIKLIGSENREPRTENREPRTENREPRTVKREPRTVNREP